MSLYFKVDWVDQRLQVLQFRLSPDYPFYLDRSEHDSIWIPSLEMGTDMVSKGEDVAYVQAGILGNFTSGAWVAKGVSVTTDVACEMDFKTFPFDHHVCRIEVRI